MYSGSCHIVLRLVLSCTICHHASAPPTRLMCSIHAYAPDGMQGLNLSAVGVETDRRGFVPVNDKMQVLDSKGKVVPHLYCIGDANGKLQCTPDRACSLTTCNVLGCQACTSGPAMVNSFSPHVVSYLKRI